jgi:hypothetical protein
MIDLYRKSVNISTALFTIFFIGSALVLIHRFGFFTDTSNLLKTPSAIITTLGWDHDGRWHLEASLNLQNYGYLITENHWIVNLWPPGMIWTNFAILEIIPSEKYFTLALIVFTSFFLSLLLTYSVTFLLTITNLFITFVGILLLLFSSSMRDWIISENIFYTDTLGVIFLSLFFIYVLKSIMYSDNNYALSFYSGLMLAAAAYYRSSYYILHYSIYVVLIILLIFTIINKVRRKADKNLQNQLYQSVIIIVVFKALTMPWINYIDTKIRPGNTSWTTQQTTGFISPWFIREDQPDFTKYGGIGWACELEKEICKNIHKIENETTLPFSGTLGFKYQEFKKMSIQAALNNPTFYIKDRSKFFLDAWFSRDGYPINTKLNPVLPSIQIMLIIFLLIYLSYLIFYHKKINALILFFSIFLLLAPFAIHHFEVRYLMSLKIISFLGLIPVYKIYTLIKNRENFFYNV